MPHVPPSVRPAAAGDLPGLLGLARAAGFGLTTLPPDEPRLARRIDASDAGHAPLFVLVERDDDHHEHVIGTSGLFRTVGDADQLAPFYAYRREKSIHTSPALHVRATVETLHLVALYDGPTEIGTLMLRPDRQGAGRGRLLSLARFLFIANRPDAFDRQVIAELRGVLDEAGCSPFWDALGRHFFQTDYATADAMSFRDKRFIAELMPTHPIYVPLLPPAAREVIGRVHPHTAPALKLLENEGFHDSGMVDIFDAGPVVRCDRDAIRTVRTSRVLQVSLVDDDAQREPNALIATAEGAFRCWCGWYDGVSATCAVPRAIAEAWGVEDGAMVRVAPLRAEPRA